jgi:hypothetical protein
MYVQRNTVARSRNQLCNGNATMPYICIVLDLHVTVNNINPLSIAMETQEPVPFAILSLYKTFHSAVNNKTYFMFTITCIINQFL